MNENNVEHDSVSNPAQYNLDKVSVADGKIYSSSEEPRIYLERLLTGHDFSGFEGASVFNIIKYVSRFPFKGKPIEDLKKAQFYLDKLIEHEETLEKAKNTVQPTPVVKESGNTVEPTQVVKESDNANGTNS